MGLSWGMGGARAGAAQWAEVGPVARVYVTVNASGMPGGSGERGRGGGEGEDGMPETRLCAVYDASQDGGYLIVGCRADDAASSGCGVRECVACGRG